MQAVAPALHLLLAEVEGEAGLGESRERSVVSLVQSPTLEDLRDTQNAPHWCVSFK